MNEYLTFPDGIRFWCYSWTAQAAIGLNRYLLRVAVWAHGKSVNILLRYPEKMED